MSVDAATITVDKQEDGSFSWSIFVNGNDHGGGYGCYTAAEAVQGAYFHLKDLQYIKEETDGR